MINRIVAVIFLILALGFYYLNLSDSWMKKIAKSRYNSTSFWASDKYRFGDLYGMSFLPDYKVDKSSDTFNLKGIHCLGNKKIVLYGLVDSYISNFNTADSLFYCVEKARFAKFYHDDSRIVLPPLDKKARNLILLCCNERNTAKYLADTQQVYGQLVPNNSSIKYNHKSFWDYIFNIDINANIEFNLIDYHFLTPIREARANLNYKLFNRTEYQVVRSKDNKMLYFLDAVDSTHIGGYTHHFTNDQIEHLIQCMLRERKHFLSMGFDDVIFNITPTSIELIDSANLKYNHLIEKIFNDPRIKPYCFNVRDSLKNNPYIYFTKSDSHWNKRGYQKWLNSFNSSLKNLTNENEHLNK